MNTPGEPDELETLMSGSVGGTRKPTVATLQGGGCLPYDVGVLYIFVEGEYVGEAYCPGLMGGRVSEWEARAMRKHNEEQARIAREQGLPARARIQDEARAARRRCSTEIRASEQARQWDRQRGDIHPARVSERLASVGAEITQARLRTLSRMLNRIVPSVFYPSATCSARRNVHDSSSFQKGDIRRDRLRSKVSEDAPRRLGQSFLAPARG